MITRLRFHFDALIVITDGRRFSFFGAVVASRNIFTISLSDVFSIIMPASSMMMMMMWFSLIDVRWDADDYFSSASSFDRRFLLDDWWAADELRDALMMMADYFGRWWLIITGPPIFRLRKWLRDTMMLIAPKMPMIRLFFDADDAVLIMPMPLRWWGRCRHFSASPTFLDYFSKIISSPMIISSMAPPIFSDYDFDWCRSRHADTPIDDKDGEIFSSSFSFSAPPSHFSISIIGHEADWWLWWLM